MYEIIEIKKILRNIESRCGLLEEKKGRLMIKNYLMKNLVGVCLIWSWWEVEKKRNRKK